MHRLILVVPVSHINELWLETDSRAYFLARQGANGLANMGWHNHHGLITGDWEDTEAVLTAYHLIPETLH